MERPDILKLIEGLQSRPPTDAAHTEDVHPADIAQALPGVGIALMDSLGIR
jgi:hypothetical protein